MKIVLCPNLEAAESVAQELIDREISFATVEAEYGSMVVRGTHATLAHHVPEFAGCPAPCNNQEILPLPLSEWGAIIVSHVDLDTVGGCLALMGQKPVDPEFWAAAEVVDVHGPHHAHRMSEKIQAQLNAYWAWTAVNRSPRVTEVTEITETVLRHGKIISRILSGDENLLAAGRQWAENILRETEERVIQENTRTRVFSTDGVFCSASYWSPKQAAVVPTTVVFNTKTRAIVIACADGQINARQIVQSLWGPEAGGHPGIAGSPRGKEMALADLVRAVDAVEAALTK